MHPVLHAGITWEVPWQQFHPFMIPDMPTAMSIRKLSIIEAVSEFPSLHDFNQEASVSICYVPRSLSGSFRQC